MIVCPDAIIDPRAVMIKPFNAFITYVAMPASWSSYDFAFRAKT